MWCSQWAKAGRLTGGCSEHVVLLLPRPAPRVMHVCKHYQLRVLWHTLYSCPSSTYPCAVRRACKWASVKKRKSPIETLYRSFWHRKGEAELLAGTSVGWRGRGAGSKGGCGPVQPHCGELE